jgi:ribosome-associated protein
MNDKLNRVVNALEDTKLTDIRIFDFRDFSPFFDFQVIATGSNERQVNASAKRLFDAVPECPSKIEGASEARWILVDFGDIIVNVMHKDEREYYQLEKLFIQHKEYSLQDIHDGV